MMGCTLDIEQDKTSAWTGQKGLDNDRINRPKDLRNRPKDRINTKEFQDIQTPDNPED